MKGVNWMILSILLFLFALMVNTFMIIHKLDKIIELLT